MKKLLAILILASGVCYGTLSTTYAPVSYDCNGATAYAFPYQFFEKSDVIVYRVTSDGSVSTLSEGSGAGKYTIYAPNNDYENGATVTAGTTYTNGQITIERSVPYGQELSIGGDFVPAKPLEQQLDKLAAQTQQVKDEIGRTITIPVTDPAGLTTELPSAALRASKLIACDASGNITAVDAIDSGTILAGDGIEVATGNTISVDISTNGLEFSSGDIALNIDTNTLEFSGGEVAVKTVDTANIADGAITFVKLADISTNVSTTSQTNLVTEGGIKAYVDTATAGVSSMTYSGTVYTNDVTASFSSLDISATVGANRAFVHAFVVMDSGASCVYHFKERNATAYADHVDSKYGTTTVRMDGVDAGKGRYVSFVTHSDGTVWWVGSGSRATTTTIVCYQVLQ